MTVSGMRPGSTTEDYRRALDGEGEFGSLGYDWSDKPHRLVYDLCAEIDRLRSQVDKLEDEIGHLNAIAAGEAPHR